MSRVVEHLAELTGYRDRDVLDVTLVGALNDLLRPIVVAIYRSVGDAQTQCWLTRARLGPGDSTATADSMWSDLDTLPALDAHPERYACLQGQESIFVAGAPAMSYFPLANELQAIGVLEMSTPQPLTAEQVHLVSSILRIYRNMQGLLDYSERDMLTGLLNRKTFNESFLGMAALAAAQDAGAVAHEARRPGRGASAWLAVIDIDHFKRVNDAYGHQIGDEVLLLLSRLMRTSFRFHDHLYRFGGEEFVVLMRCNDEDDANVALARLRQRVGNYVFPQVGHITVSVGFTELRPGDTPGSAFERADKAVYHVKQHGRDGLASHAELVRTGQLDEPLRGTDIELF